MNTWKQPKFHRAYWDSKKLRKRFLDATLNLHIPGKQEEGAREISRIQEILAAFWTAIPGNGSDPFARNTILSRLRSGLEKPVDEKFVEKRLVDFGFIAYLGRQHLPKHVDIELPAAA